MKIEIYDQVSADCCIQLIMGQVRESPPLSFADHLGACHMSRDILTSHGSANGHAIPADWFVAADFLFGPDDPLLACRRDG